MQDEKQTDPAIIAARQAAMIKQKEEEAKHKWQIPEDKLKMLTYPDPILLKKAEPVTKFNQELKQLVYDMQSFMMKLPGTPAGLAAPQIGVSKRLFITVEGVYVNPEVKITKNLQHCAEGCYSLKPDKFYTWRAQSVFVKYQDVDGVWHEDKYNGFRAQVIQHENDHLEGILCDPSQDIQGN